MLVFCYGFKLLYCYGSILLRWVIASNSKYTEDFKKEVGASALEEGATLKSVGEKYGVNPTLVRNWKLKYFTNEAAEKSEDTDSGEVIDFDDFFEVVITDEDSNEWFYWVECQDEDDAVEAAMEKHEELERPDAVDDFDEGVFPSAYQPVIEDNQELALIIRADEL